MAKKPTKDDQGWRRVIFASDCIYGDWDTDHEEPICPVCKTDYSDCPCPGPHQEDINEYKMIRGVLHARAKKEEADAPK